MSAYETLQNKLRASPGTWLVTGVAGFIGSNLLETLLQLGQRVVGLDNFATGHQSNLEQVRQLVGSKGWARFRFVKGDICEPTACRGAVTGVDFVLHQAALGSVPRSIEAPIAAHEANVTGFLNMLVAARDARVKRFVFASSSAVYGDSPRLPKVEHETGRPLSPYAATKMMDEVYASAFANAYGLSFIALRYFNVFGRRQDPKGAYAAVIPAWIDALLKRRPVYINGDGKTSRDFCYIDNVVQANLLAATTNRPAALNQVYNIALGERTTLNQLFAALQNALRRLQPSIPKQKPVHRAFRPGDVRHSLANIGKARRLLGFAPTCSVCEGLDQAMEWYRNAGSLKH